MAEMVIGRGMVEILPDFRKFGKELTRSMRTARAQLDGSTAGLRASAATTFNSLAKVGKGTTLLGIGVAAASVKMAGDFQAETAVLQTAAGETAAGLKDVRKGILSISEGTGTGIKNLTDGMYTIEKAGFRGKQGLDVLRAAAQGAKEENADLADVTNAMTSVMASYHLHTTDSVRVMNALKTAAGEGKITMEEFSGALSTVLPIASANKISFEEVGGAIATLTQHGTSAREATQELSATIRRLAAPNNVAIREMARFGLSATDVSQNLGKRGLSGTIDLLTSTILGKMGPSGTVLLSAFEGTKQSAQAARVMLSKMPADIQEIAKSYQGGKISLEDWNQALKATPVGEQPMLRNFKTLTDRSKGFSRELKAGGPAVKTYTESLQKMSGGAIGLNTILQLSGESTDGYKERIKKVGESYHNASKDVEGWKVTQGLFNTQLARMKQTFQVLMIELGTKLIPILQAMVSWFSKNKEVVILLAGVIAGVLTLAVVSFAAKTVVSAGKVVASFAKMGASAVKMGISFVRGMASASAAASSSTGLAGTIGGSVRKALSPSTYASAFSTLRLRGMYAVESLKSGFRSVGTAATSMATTVKTAAVSAGSAAWSGITSGVKAVGSAMKTAALATGTFVKAQAEAALANTRAAISWTIAKTKTLAQAAATAIATAAQWLWNAAMDANPITLIIIGIAALVAAIVWIATKTTWFQTIWKASWGAIKDAFFYVWNFIKDHWKLMVQILGGPIAIAVIFVLDHWKQITGGFNAMLGFIRDHWVLIVSIITGPIGTAVLYVVRHWGAIVDGARDMLSDLRRFFQALPGTIKGYLGDLTKLLTQKGHDVITGFLSGMKDAFLAVTKWVSGIAKWIKDHKGPISLDRTLLHPAGKALMHGLLEGLKFGFKGVGSFVYKAGSKISDITSKIASGFGDSLNIGASFGSGNLSSNMKIGKEIMLQMGFQPREWQALRTLWTNESGWRTNALNASSGAYGIPQSLPASKMASAGADWRTNPATQIRWGLDYIKRAYGTPSFALAKWMDRSPHWYDQGGWLPPGLSLAMNGTGRPERIRTASQEAALGAGTVQIVVVNKGVIGSKQDAIDFLVGALTDISRQGRIPRGYGG
jgi:phage-related protein